MSGEQSTLNGELGRVVLVSIPDDDGRDRDPSVCRNLTEFLDGSPKRAYNDT